MNRTLNYLRGGRRWLVPNLAVWGAAAAYQMPLAMVEESSPKRLIFCLAELGGEEQLVNYTDLVDSLGNRLPATISNPIVVIIPRGKTHCYLVGRPSNSGFKIARDSSVGQSVVDVLIMEVDSL
ncbi:MAG: hypothetical protein GX409_04900 [candidate division Zixibacteria bacterium]|nr:hypothetical protein [candidate division Zixibacteria bacterium]